MKLVPNAVSRQVFRTALVTSKHSPKILFGVGVVGFGVTVVMACKATLKVDEVLSDHEKKMIDVNTVQHVKYTDSERRHDKAILYSQTSYKLVKLYGPALAVGTLSVAALTGSHHILTKRNAGLTAAYTALAEGFNAYRQRVRDDLGAEADVKFRYGTTTREIAEDTPEGPVVKTITGVGPHGASVYAKFFDQTNLNWNSKAELNRIFLAGVQNYMNDRLHAHGHLFLNEVYDALGIDRTQAGAVVGWVLNNGDNYVDFGLYNARNDQARAFVNGHEGAVLLDFNVDGPVHNLIGEPV
jgi:hypothetical protein